MDSSELRTLGAALTAKILAVDRFRRLIEDNGGDLDLTLRIRAYRWNGGYDARASGDDALTPKPKGNGA